VLEVDHLLPNSQDDKDEYNNWQLLHAHCHHYKTGR
jgi:RNA-directed DNA polymerase